MLYTRLHFPFIHLSFRFLLFITVSRVFFLSSINIFNSLIFLYCSLFPLRYKLFFFYIVILLIFLLLIFLISLFLLLHTCYFFSFFLIKNSFTFATSILFNLFFLSLSLPFWFIVFFPSLFLLLNQERLVLWRGNALISLCVSVED